MKGLAKISCPIVPPGSAQFSLPLPQPRGRAVSPSVWKHLPKPFLCRTSLLSRCFVSGMAQGLCRAPLLGFPDRLAYILPHQLSCPFGAVGHPHLQSSPSLAGRG